MPGNTMSLYSSTGSNASVSGTNTSGLYGTTGTVTVGTTGYSNVNVAAFLQSYTGNLQAGNAVILGNITAGNIIGPVTGDVTGSVTGNVTGNFAGGNITANYGVFNNDLNVAGTIYGTFSGNIAGNLVVPGGNTEILFNNSGNAGANVNFAFDQATQIMSLNGQANITGNVTAGNVITVGNVTANYFIGNGSQLTGLPATYANSDVANFLAAFGSNSISTTGNVTAGYFMGNGALLTSITGANVTGVVANAAYANNAGLSQFVTGNAQANITSLGTLTSLSVSGNTALGNVYVAGPGNVDVGNNIISNVADPIASSDAATKSYVDSTLAGSGFDITDGITTETIIPGDTVTFSGTANQTTVTVTATDTVTVGLPNDVAIVGNLTASSVSATGNITGNYFIGDGSFLTNINAGNISGSYGNANVANYLANFGSNAISTTGNITAGYFIGNGSQLTGLPAGYSNSDVANFLAAFGSNSISTTGNVTSGNIIADAQYLANIPGGNVTGTVANATYAINAGHAVTANTVIDAAQPNITSVGNLTALTVSGDSLMLGNLQVNGNVTYIASNTVTINDKFINVANNAANSSQANGGGIGVGPAGSEYATWSFSDANTAWQSNIKIEAPALSAAGNITGAYIIGNGALLTSITGANVTGTVANATYALSANSATFAGTVTANSQPNITSVGTLTSLSVSGNTTSGNLLTGGLISATGNVTGGNVIGTYLWGDGSNITGVVAGSASTQLPVKNATASTIAAGTPVYATGTVGASTTLEIAPSLANTAATMPAVGLTTTSLAPNAQGYAISVGTLKNVNTSAYTVGQILYVAPGGGLTGTRPNDGYLVQPVGTVGRVGTSDGSIDTNIWNYFQLPNLGSGNFWVGNANSVPTETTLATYTGNIGAGNLSVTGNIQGGNITITGVYSGNGSGLTSLNGANVTGTVANATYALSANNATFAGTVTANAQPNITSVGTLSSLSVSGNVTGNYFIGNGSQLTGIAGTYSNANVASFLANFGSNTISTTGNISGGVMSAAGNIISGAGFYGPVVSASGNVIGTGFYGSLVSVSGNVTAGNLTTGIISATGNITTAGQVSATGNITGGNIFSLGIFTTSGNANINGNLYASNVLTNGLVSAQGNIVTGSGFYGPLVSATGNITAGNRLFANVVSATGTVYGNYFQGDGGGLSNIANVVLQGNMTGNINGNGYSIVNLQTLEVNGNINGANLILTGGIEAVDSLLIIGDIEMDGNIIMNGAAPDGGANIDYINGGGYARFGGNVISAGGYLIAGIPGSGGVQFVNTDGTAGQVLATHGNGVTYWSNTASTYNDANVSSFLANFGSNSISTTGNITAGYFIGNGSQLTSITAANITGTVANATYALNANAATFAGTVTTNAQPNITSVGTLTALSVTGNVTGGNLITGGLLTVTGNITAGNISTAGIVTASNLTANLQFANIITNNQQIQTVGARSPSTISATVADPGRIVIGTGYNGNLSPGNDLNVTGRGCRLLVSDAFNITDIQQRVIGIGVQQYATATANVSNSNTRILGISGQLALGGGAAGNTWTGGILTIVGTNGAVTIGGGTSGNLTALGNTTVNGAAGMSGSITINAGSTIRNAWGSQGIIAAAGTVGNVLGFGTQLATTGSPTITGNVAAFYHPGTSTTFGPSTANVFRQATNYYFLMNEDNVARTRMGSMWLWHNYRYTHTTTTGAITVDKNNGQTQYLAVTGNITGITLSNFVTTASNGATDQEQMDTVTLYVRQDATGRTITMPTGANYFYESGNTTVDITANSITKIEFTAINNAGTTQYLIDISPAYTST